MTRWKHGRGCVGIPGGGTDAKPLLFTSPLPLPRTHLHASILPGNLVAGASITPFRNFSVSAESLVADVHVNCSSQAKSRRALGKSPDEKDKGWRLYSNTCEKHQADCQQGGKQWRTPRRDGKFNPAAVQREIAPGVAGIWATCDMKKEGQCVSELRDLFEQVSQHSHPTGSDAPA